MFDMFAMTCIYLLEKIVLIINNYEKNEGMVQHVYSKRYR